MSDGARTKSEGLMDIDYSVRLYELHARYYRRLRNLFAFISLTSGTAVVAAVLRDSTVLASAFSFLLALMPILEAITDPAGKSVFFDGYRRQFCALKSKVLREQADIETIDICLAELYAEPADEIEALRKVALRDNLRAHGHEDWLTRPLTAYEKLWAFIA